MDLLATPFLILILSKLQRNKLTTTTNSRERKTHNVVTTTSGRTVIRSHNRLTAKECSWSLNSMLTGTGLQLPKDLFSVNIPDQLFVALYNLQQCQPRQCSTVYQKLLKRCSGLDECRALSSTASTTCAVTTTQRRSFSSMPLTKLNELMLSSSTTN